MILAYKNHGLQLRVHDSRRGTTFGMRRIGIDIYKSTYTNTLHIEVVPFFIAINFSVGVVA